MKLLGTARTIGSLFFIALVIALVIALALPVCSVAAAALAERGPTTETGTEPALNIEPPNASPPLMAQSGRAHSGPVNPGLNIPEGLSKLEQVDNPFRVLCGRLNEPSGYPFYQERVEQETCLQAQALIRAQLLAFDAGSQQRLVEISPFYKLFVEGVPEVLRKRGRGIRVSLRGGNSLVSYWVPVATTAQQEELEAIASDIYSLSDASLLCVPPSNEVDCGDEAELPYPLNEIIRAQAIEILNTYACPPALVDEFSRSEYSRGVRQYIVFGLPSAYGGTFLRNLFDRAEEVLMGDTYLSIRAFNLDLIRMAKALQLANVFNSRNILISRLFLNMMRLAKGMVPFEMQLMPELANHTAEDALDIYEQNWARVYGHRWN